MVCSTENSTIVTPNLQHHFCFIYCIYMYIYTSILFVNTFDTVTKIRYVTEVLIEGKDTQNLKKMKERKKEGRI